MTEESDFDSWQGQEFYLLSEASRPALRPTPPPVKWVAEGLYLGQSRPEREATPPPLYTSSRLAQGTFFCTLYG
jgi:hypothetical protein